MLTVIIIYYYHPKFLICFADVEWEVSGQHRRLFRRTRDSYGCTEKATTLSSNFQVILHFAIDINSLDYLYFRT